MLIFGKINKFSIALALSSPSGNLSRMFILNLVCTLAPANSSLPI